MDTFIARKRPRQSPDHASTPASTSADDEESTDLKLTLLLSLFPDLTQDELLDILTASDGNVEVASSTISSQNPTTTSPPSKKRATLTTSTNQTPKIQTSLSSHIVNPANASQPKKTLTKKGKTLHLYTPEEIATHTPCSLILNFLPASEATALLQELLEESAHFSRRKFQLFDRTVQSPHSHAIYISSAEEHRQHTTQYKYGGTYRSDTRQITPHMRAVSGKVQTAVNEEIRKRIREYYPGGKKLKFQSPREWMPNAAFANCYDGPSEGVGFHSDELTYLGPRPVIGSLSLGVEREFRVRRVVPPDSGSLSRSHSDDGDHDPDASKEEQTPSAADSQGQISIHLPHNSLLVMHAEMQEEWKHSITPCQTVSPHPVSGNRRINITYRWYRESLHPRYTPRCYCGSHAVLKCVQRKKETRGRYMWTCYAGYAPGKKSCSFFQWAEFDDDGEPVWEKTISEDSAPDLRNFAESK